MLDSEYFRSRLPKDVKALGGVAVVELRLLGGLVHRVHQILDAGDGYLLIESYERRSAEAALTDNWKEQLFDPSAGGEVSRVAIPYESILDVVVLAGRSVTSPRIGFGIGD